jgi:glycosyltransferase involved in cell wall biosynthesis
MAGGEPHQMIAENIICFANDWGADPLSKKQVMRRLARKHRILWINSINNRRPRLARKDLGRALQKLTQFRHGLVQVDEHIWVLAPLYLPFHSLSLFRNLNRRLLGWQIRRAARRLGIENPITWACVPNAADVVGTLGEKCVVYHCVDEYSAFNDAAPEVRFRERDLLKKADLVLVCSDYLRDGKLTFNRHTHLVTHGVDFEHFSRAAEESTRVADELRSLPRPILGFHGLLADWVDLGVVGEIARQRPEWSIVLIGKSETDLSPVQNLPNVHLFGHRPYERLPEYLRGFDVAILPFVCNELTFNSNPLKLREYLAAGLPVVAAPLPEVAKFSGLALLARTSQEYIQAVECLLRRGETGPSYARSRMMIPESWEVKISQMEELLEFTLARKTMTASSPKLC